MAFPDVIINQISSNQGRQLPGFDHYTGLMFYGTAPSVTGKWASYTGTPTIKTQQMFSSSDATSAGIVPFTDNTAPTATYLITTAATAAGEFLPISVDEPLQNGTSRTIDIGTYETVSGDTAIDTLGANLVIFINAGTVTHGYSASYNSGTNTLTITAPKTVGVSLNSGSPLDIDETGTDIVGTVTQFSGGTVSPYAIWYYHIKEYFRVNPGGNLTVGIISASSSFNELTTLQQAADSRLRQIGIYDNHTTRGLAANITGTITQIQAACIVSQKKAPFSLFYSPNITAVTDLSTYPDQNLNTANKVQCIISQDGLADGALLYVKSGQTIGNIGAKLGSISKSRVSSSDAQATAEFNMSDGVENNAPAFGNGKLSTEISEGTQIQLDNFRYTFFRQFGDTVVGTYWTDNKCCIISTSDLAFVNDNRVQDKVSRICYATYVPLLSSELIFDGLKLKDYTVETFKDAGEDAIVANMITGFGALPLISGVSVSIDPDQPVKQTNNLTVVVTINQNGIARTITVNVGFGAA